MKTTIDIPDTLLKETKRLATTEQTTLKALVIEGLRHILSERQKNKSFQLRKVTFRGIGLQQNVASASWEQIRDMSYERRSDHL
jgi:hypothetical protein